jgi:hypothetical protein
MHTEITFVAMPKLKSDKEDIGRRHLTAEFQDGGCKPEVIVTRLVIMIELPF